MTIEIKGIVETDISTEEWTDKFINWLEANGWKFGGMTREWKE